MSETEPETQDTPDETETPAEDTPTTDAGHVSSVTDLPEGAEVDPLTDQGPQAVVDKEEHDG